MHVQKDNNSNEMLNTQNTKRFRLCEMIEPLFIAKLNGLLEKQGILTHYCRYNKSLLL